MRRRSGYTLIEILVVMGIIILMVTMVLLSVASMIKSSRMSRAVSLLVAAADEARTAAITIRRSTKVDVTQMDAEGWYNRLTVVGPFFNDNFDEYWVNNGGPKPPKAKEPLDGMWVSTPPGAVASSDGTRCLKVGDLKSGSQQYVFNVGNKIDTIKRDDNELNILARVKFLPSTNRTKVRTVRILGSIAASGATLTDAYRLNLVIDPMGAAPGRNSKSNITLDRMGGSVTPDTGATDNMLVDLASGPTSATTTLVEGVWYRVSFSMKLVTEPVTNIKTVKVAGKVWADGQLEPWAWTVGPCKDTGGTVLGSGPGGFHTEDCEALVDDVLFDVRPIRVIPHGLRLDAMYPTVPGSIIPAEWEVASSANPFNFPILFRPDGTAAEQYVIRITDLTSSDKRYVTVDQNTGRSRLVHSLKEAIEK